MGRGSGNFCAVAGCSNSSRKARKLGKRLSFHSFPKDLARQKEWVVKCRRGDFLNVKCAKICSEHFNKEDFELNFREKLMGVRSKRSLLPNVIPTLNLPAYHATSQRRRTKNTLMDPQNSGVNPGHCSPSPVVKTDKSPEEEGKEILLAELLSAVSKPTDSHQPFIDYVANEMRNITNVSLQNKLKRIIMNAVISISDEELQILAQNNAFK